MIFIIKTIHTDHMIEWLFKKRIEERVKEITANTQKMLEVTIRENLTPIIRQEVISEIEVERKYAWKNDCDFLFHFEGHDYFSYKNEKVIKLERFHRTGLELIALGNRLNSDELGKLVACGKKAIEKIINGVQLEKKIKHLEEVQWVFKEMENRRETLMFHNGIIIELLALNIIRDDEDPKEINEKIHNEKKNLFKTKGGDIPFLVQASLQAFIPDIEKLVNAITKSWELHNEQIELANTTYEKIYSELNS
jgi:hypothetical protein